jgi:Na+/H+ antiporter NhaD/arsenite permease-like protein
MVSPFSIIPFVLLLGLIAAMPFINKHWWESHYPHVAVALALPVIGYYLFVIRHVDRIATTGHEYLSFIIFIGSLFVVAGGIHIRIRGKATPLSNVLYLAAGAVIANVMGTTGASMIMIRPFLRVNKYRLRAFHVVFFIFIISNVGGALTPIGDPPLFLGYLRGVPFFWVLEYAWHMWALALGALLVLFFVIDYISLQSHRKHHSHTGAAEAEEEAEVSGLPNFLFLAVIVCAAFVQHPEGVREALMLLAAAGSYFLTKKEVHAKNEFNFAPIKEVAILFFGIFATMIPALEWLEQNAGQIGISTPGQFYWGAGLLSSVLDNAPTYLSFLSASIGLFVDADIVSQVQHLVATNGADVALVAGRHSEEIRNTFATLMKYHGDLVAARSVPVDDINISYLIGNHNIYLRGISIASVFFGACTYIGNGPNFMVRSIAEQAHAHVPSFAGYIGRYTLPILVPVLVCVWFVFFR